MGVSITNRYGGFRFFIYRSSISFGGPEAATKLNSQPITTTVYTDLPPQGGKRYFSSIVFP